MTALLTALTELFKKLFPPRHTCKFDGSVEYIHGTKFVHCSHPGCDMMDDPGLQEWLNSLPHAKALRRYQLLEIFWKHYETWTGEEQSSFWREQREREPFENINDFVYRKAQGAIKNPVSNPG